MKPLSHHTLVFIQHYGPVIGQYPYIGDDPNSSIDSFLSGMKLRWEQARMNDACIAAYWYVNGELTTQWRRDE